MIKIWRRMRRGEFHIDFIGRAGMWFAISGAVVLVSLGSLYVRGFNTGLEFKGGTSFVVQASSRGVSVTDVEDALGEAEVHEATVQRVGDRGFLISTEHLDTKTQRAALDALAETTGVDTSDINVQDVGPKWGRQISNKAVRALVVFLVVATLYMSIRLEPKMAGAAMLALIHDLIATAGVYSLAGFTVTPATIIALLTVLGYSLYDTVVIFDRVKDRTVNLSASGNVTYSQAANASLNQVLMRSLNTTVTGLLPVGSLLFVGSFLLGAQTLRELALALFVGLTAGAYSSVTIATPALAIWKERETRWSTLRARIAARGVEAPPPPLQPVRAPAQPQLQTPVAVVDEVPAPSTIDRPTSPGRPGAQKRRRKRKRKRR